MLRTLQSCLVSGRHLAFRNKNAPVVPHFSIKKRKINHRRPEAKNDVLHRSGWVLGSHTCMHTLLWPFSDYAVFICTLLVAWHPWINEWIQHSQSIQPEPRPVATGALSIGVLENSGFFSPSLLSVWIFWRFIFLAFSCYPVCMWCVCMGVHMWQLVWKSEDNLMELGHSPHIAMWAPGAEPMSLKCCGRYLSLNRLAGPSFWSAGFRGGRAVTGS